MTEKLMYYTIYPGDLVPYVALAKQELFVIDQLPYEPGETVHAFGFTEEKALRNLKDRLPGNEWKRWTKEEGV